MPRMQALPCSRAYEHWDAYLTEALPLLGARCEALRLKCVRRARFASYMRRDSELDRICKLLCGTSTRKERLARLAAAGEGLSPPPTLVAFGAANACSTRFGYAPAPQARLRHRLAAFHGARVTLIDEFRTSRVCSCCHQLLEETHKSPGAAAKSQAQRAAGARARARTGAEAEARLTTRVYGVLRCRACQEQLGKPLFWHRDVNAARNILSVYMSLASEGRRPAAFARPAEQQAPPIRQRRAATMRDAPKQTTGRELRHSRGTSRSMEPSQGPAGVSAEHQLQS